MEGSKKHIALFLAVVFIGIILYALTERSPEELKTKEEVVETNQFNEITGLRQGNKAPEFSVTTIDGRKITLSELTSRNRPVVLYFFATWCPKCMADLTAHKKIYTAYKDKIEFIAVDLDYNEDAELIKTYVEKNGFLGDFAAAQKKALVDYNVRYTTTKYVIDKEGNIVYAGSGPLKEEQWKIIFDALLA